MARWYVGASSVLWGMAVVNTLAAFISESWVEDGNERAVKGKTDAVWVLTAFAAFFAVVGSILLFSRFWARGKEWFMLLAIFCGIAQVGLQIAADRVYRHEQELDRSSGETFGIGMDLTTSAAVLMSLSVAALLWFTIRMGRHARHTLTKNQKRLIVSLLGLYLYIYLGGIAFQHLEDLNFRVAVNFSLETITTIGYGITSPETTEGRVFLFVYATLGFSIVGFSVKTVWEVLVRQMDHRILNHYSSRRDRINAVFRRKLIIKIKVAVGLSVWTVVMLGGAGYFAWREKWTYFEGIWFSFSTLTTIGYGDFAPTARSSANFFLLYVLVGLGSVGFLVSLIAETMVNNVEERVIKGSDVQNQEMVKQVLKEKRREAEASGKCIDDATDKASADHAVSSDPSATAAANDTTKAATTAAGHWVEVDALEMTRFDKSVEYVLRAARLVIAKPNSVTLDKFRRAERSLLRAIIQAGYHVEGFSGQGENATFFGTLPVPERDESMNMSFVDAGMVGKAKSRFLRGKIGGRNNDSGGTGDRADPSVAPQASDSE